MKRGQTHRHTDTWTSRLLDRIGPVGQFYENYNKYICMSYLHHEDLLSLFENYCEKVWTFRQTLVNESHIVGTEGRSRQHENPKRESSASPHLPGNMQGFGRGLTPHL